ncbi:unnamed protein product [Alopecurus aequalis]
MSHTKTRMEEAWRIKNVAFNVSGLSVDCFIPTADIRSGSVGKACELPRHGDRAKTSAIHHARIATVERAHGHSVGVNIRSTTGRRGEQIVWRVEV